MARTDLKRLGVVCDCAAIPPTIPLYREAHDHLPTCPVARWTANQAGLAWARDMLNDSARASVEMSGMSAVGDLRAEFGSFSADHGSTEVTPPVRVESEARRAYAVWVCGACDNITLRHSNESAVCAGSVTEGTAHEALEMCACVVEVVALSPADQPETET